MSATSFALNRLSHETVRSFYLQRLNQLPLEVQLQFATFLYLWNGDPEAQRHLHHIQPLVTCEGDVEAMFKRVIEQTNTTHYDKTTVGPIVAPYFSRHPKLYAHTWLLLYLMYLETVYDIDGREQLLSIVPLKDFRKTKCAIEKDTEALAMLSVVGINNL